LLSFFALFDDCDDVNSPALKWQLVANILTNIGLLLLFHMLYLGTTRAHLTSIGFKWFLGVWSALLVINSLIVVSYNGDGNGIGLFVLLIIQQMYYLIYVSLLMYYGAEQENDILSI
jgi:hypothetical protein